MHRAYSAIFFTTASGLGYGLLILLGLMGGAGLIAADRGFALAAFGLAFASVTLALFVSTLHLGHPGRSLRALGRLRASWLSREGVAALATYLPTGLFALGWMVRGETSGAIALAGVIGAIGAAVTVYCTAKIYASLATVAAWSNRWTVPGYLALALATGSLWLAALARLFDIAHPAITHLPVALIMLGWIVKVAYWWSLDHKPRDGGRDSTAEPAGEGVPGDPLAAPHTQGALVIRRIGYRIARKRAVRLRRAAQGLAFALPLVLTELEMFWPDAPASLHTTLAMVSACVGTAGVALERWLFFAEARHVVALDPEPERH